MLAVSRDVSPAAAEAYQPPEISPDRIETTKTTTPPATAPSGAAHVEAILTTQGAASPPPQILLPYPFQRGLAGHNAATVSFK